MEKLNRESLPDYCPMKHLPEHIQQTHKQYEKKEVRDMYRPSTITEYEAYETVRGEKMAVRPRVKELIEFGKMMDIKKMGIAFCVGLKDEAHRLSDILESQGFQAASVLCKCGGIDKTLLGMEKQYKIKDPESFEAGCNPVLQADLLDKAGAELNIIVGLCLGHDIMFTKYSKAPVTTFIVKDRLLGHNPTAALYSNYHKEVVKKQGKM
jgi:uncharacterized metal-binding protein